MNNDNKSNNLEKCLRDYFDYHCSILLPALDELENKIEDNKLKLHQAIGFNMILSHALDYFLAIQNSRFEDQIYRKSLMKHLDNGYSIEGGKFTNGKFQLIDAVNNSIKHINLDNNRYKKIIKEYFCCC